MSRLRLYRERELIDHWIEEEEQAQLWRASQHEDDVDPYQTMVDRHLVQTMDDKYKTQQEDNR